MMEQKEHIAGRSRFPGIERSLKVDCDLQMRRYQTLLSNVCRRPARAPIVLGKSNCGQNVANPFCCFVLSPLQSWRVPRTIRHFLDSATKAMVLYFGRADFRYEPGSATYVCLRETLHKLCIHSLID